jgi:hypothetical protein
VVLAKLHQSERTEAVRVIDSIERNLTLAGTPRQPAALACRSYQEVGRILGISWQAVRQGELRALEKLREHPTMKRLWNEDAE